jgi:hypothetical protein
MINMNNSVHEMDKHALNQTLKCRNFRTQRICHLHNPNIIASRLYRLVSGFAKKDLSCGRNGSSQLSYDINTALMSLYLLYHYAFTLSIIWAVSGNIDTVSISRRDLTSIPSLCLDMCSKLYSPTMSN